MKQTAKRGLGDSLKSTLSRYNNLAVIAAVFIIGVGLFSLMYGPIGITGKAIARPAGECTAVGGTATGVMLLGQAGPYAVAGKMSKQNSCGQQENYPAASVKSFLLLGELCEDAAGILTLTLEGGTKKRFKSGCTAAGYAEAATSAKLVKSFCYNDNKDVKLNIIGCDCDNGDCKNLKQCAATEDCRVQNAQSECVDKGNGLGKRCYLQEGAACHFLDDCVGELNCINNICTSGEAPLVAVAPSPPPAKEPVKEPVVGQAAQAPPGKSLLSRTFNTKTPAPGSKVTVTLHFQEVGQEPSLIINEQVPTGLELLKDGKRAPANNYRKAIVDGLTGTVESTKFTYEVEIPQDVIGGDYIFIGKRTLQSGQTDIAGDYKLTIAGLPAPPAQRPDLPDIACKTSRDCKGHIQGMCNRKTQKCEMVAKGKACDRHEQCLTGYCKSQCRLRPVTFPCDTNEQCDSNQCIDGACGGKPNGEACSTAKECFSGKCAGDNLFDENGDFTGVSPDKTCKPQQLGRRCAIDEQCVLGYCNSKSEECELRPAGMECFMPTDEQKAHMNTPKNQFMNIADDMCMTKKCDNGACSGKSEGEACQSFAQCQSNFCWQGSCQTMQFGSDCRGNEQCATGICKKLGPGFNRCVSPIGGACNYHNDCDSGICKKEGPGEGICEGTPSGDFGHPCGEGYARCKPGLTCNPASKACIFSEEGFAEMQGQAEAERAAAEERQRQAAAEAEAEARRELQETLGQPVLVNDAIEFGPNGVKEAIITFDPYINEGSDQLVFNVATKGLVSSNSLAYRAGQFVTYFVKNPAEDSDYVYRMNKQIYVQGNDPVLKDGQERAVHVVIPRERLRSGETNTVKILAGSDSTGNWGNTHDAFTIERISTMGFNVRDVTIQLNTDSSGAYADAVSEEISYRQNAGGATDYCFINKQCEMGYTCQASDQAGMRCLAGIGMFCSNDKECVKGKCIYNQCIDGTGEGDLERNGFNMPCSAGECNGDLVCVNSYCVKEYPWHAFI